MLSLMLSLDLLKLALLLSSTAFAMEPRDHVFDTSKSYTHPTDSVVNILNVNPHQIAVAYTTSLLLLRHADLNMIEDPMEQVWMYSLPNKDNTIVAGPVSLPSSSNGVPNEVFIGDNEYNVYSIDIVTGKLKWMQALDPNIQAATRHMHLAVSPNGRALVASAGDQVMAMNIDHGSILFHRSFGPAVISTKFAFVAPPSGQTATLYATKMVFGDSSGVVRAMDLATGRKSWSWKFSTSSSSIVDLVLDKAGSAGVDVVLAVNQIGDLSAIRGDTGTLLWRSHVLQSGTITDDLVVLHNSGILMDQETCLLLSNDDAHGALIHSVNMRTGTSSVLTMLSGPGSTVGGLHLDETVPSIFVTLNDNIKVFSPMKPTVVMKEFAIHGFPSTSLTSVTGVSQPCHHYIGTTDGTVTLVHFSNYAKGSGACKYRQDDQEEEL